MTDTPEYSVTVTGTSPFSLTYDDMDSLQEGFTVYVGMSYNENTNRVRCYFNLPAASSDDAMRLGSQMVNNAFRGVIGVPLTKTTTTAKLAPPKEQAEQIVSDLLGP